MRPTHSSPLSRQWPLLGLAILFAAVIAAPVLTWAGTSPARAQDGYQPDQDLIDDVWEYAEETEHGYDHVLRRMRVLKTLGIVEDMTAAHARENAEKYTAERWDPVVAELEKLEEAPGNYEPDEEVLDDIRDYARELRHGFDHVLRRMRVLKHPSLTTA